MFRTHDGRADRLVAVKAFKLDLLPEDSAKLADALRRLATLASPHPAIVSVLDAGLEDATPFLAMALLTGDTLDVALRDLAPATPDRALPIIQVLASAIDAAWATGMGHGALHPRDVFLTPGSNRLGITGFGVVQALESAGIAAPPRRPYAAPERVAGGPWQRAADVYALAAIAHELLTGRRPVAGGEQDGVFSNGIPAARRVAVRRVLARGLAEAPAQRYGAAHDFIAALEAAIEGEGQLTTASLFDIVEPPAETAAILGARAAKPEPPVFAHEPTASSPSSSSFVHVPAKPDVHADAAGVSADATHRHVPETPARRPVIPNDLATFAPEPAVSPSPKTTSVLRDEFAPEISGGAVRHVEPSAPPAPAPPVTLGGAASAFKPQPRAAAPPPGPPAPPAPPSSGRSLFDEEPTPQPPAWTLREERPLRSVPADAPPSRSARRGSFPWVAMAVVLLAGIAIGTLGGYQFARQRFASSGASATTVSVREAGRPADTEVAVAPPDAASPAGATPPAAGEVPRGTSAAPEVKRTAAPLGRLVIHSTPTGALVTVDGHVVGETPLTVRDLALGSHSVQVARPGFAPHAEDVSLSPGSPARNMTVTLEKGLVLPGDTSGAIPGTLDVDSRPRGARVTVDGRPVGVTPVRIAEMPPGRYDVVVAMSGYRPVTSRAIVEPGRPATLRVNLER